MTVQALCQRGPASCGACCGIYNFKSHSRAAVHKRLSAHTAAIAAAPKTPEGYRAAAAGLRAGDGEPLFPLVRCCPLVGYLDAAETRIGCLAHPAVTGGPDLRDCGAYDAEICERFLCPSHSWLGEAEAELVARTCADHYLYGLVVTDVPFLRAVLAAVAERGGAQVELRHLDAAPFRAALRALFALKEELRPGSEGLFGAFEPGADGEPRPRQIDYVQLGRPRSAYDEILLCIGADPRSGNDLEALENEVICRLDACAAAFGGGQL